MGGCTSVGRLVLVILNIIFLLISLGLLAVGGILKYMPGTLMGFLLAGAQSAIPPLPTASGGSTLPSIMIPDTLSFVPMVDDVATVLLALGGVLFCISFLACCGACYKWRPLLILFAIVMVLLILGIAVVGALFLVKDSVLHDTIRSSLAEKTEEEYEKNQNGPFIQITNVLALQMKCCGFTGPSDFVKNLTTDFKDVPVACCEDMKQTCLDTTRRNLTDIETTGCYDKLQDMIEDSKTYAIVGLVGVLLLLLIEVVFAIVIVVDIGSNKVGQS
ncbi:CD63 antigen-like [Haliotis rubra]|uniref:CD63 antigen-like n=1 Tax=Haliotis rubra TaxID=36100 RepID=UPI001EE5EE25|nr:CD63 antigen-like [Haliotis rubra]XP_046580886.1 CD63 antigen-like [Haliotis rubra]XP_046580890.1 CD63 antigen-like [Haliotis rubra]XP_046580895.1 CD63 antigen-like [Haliotis rubra]